MGFHCYLTPAAAVWLIGRREALGRKWGGVKPLLLRLCPTLLPPCFVASKAVKGYLRGVTMDFSTLLTGSCGDHLRWPVDAVPSVRHTRCLPADGPRLVIESVFTLRRHCQWNGKGWKLRWLSAGATAAVRGVSWCKVRHPVGCLDLCYLVAMLLCHGIIRNLDVAFPPLVSFIRSFCLSLCCLFTPCVFFFQRPHILPFISDLLNSHPNLLKT